MSASACPVCLVMVEDELLVDHIEELHPPVLDRVRGLAISERGETVTIERRHLERVVGETEDQWLRRMARNLGYITHDEAAAQIGCRNCGTPLLVGFRYHEVVVAMIEGIPVCDLYCGRCGKEMAHG